MAPSVVSLCCCYRESLLATLKGMEKFIFPHSGVCILPCPSPICGQTSPFNIQVLSLTRVLRGIKSPENTKVSRPCYLRELLTYHSQLPSVGFQGCHTLLTSGLLHLWFCPSAQNYSIPPCCIPLPLPSYLKYCCWGTLLKTFWVCIWKYLWVCLHFAYLAHCIFLC